MGTPIYNHTNNRLVTSADPSQIKKNSCTTQHQVFLKEEQIKVKRIENKAEHERRQQQLVYEQGPDQAEEMEDELAKQKARF